MHKSSNRCCLSGASAKNKLCYELESKIQFKESILASQGDQIQLNYVQLCRINADYQRIDCLRRQAITQLERLAGMSEYEVERLPLDADFEVVYRVLQERIDEFLKRRWKEFSKG